MIKNTMIYEHIKDYLPVIPILELKKGEYLFRAERKTGNLFYIFDGLIKVENISYNGKADCGYFGCGQLCGAHQQYS